MLPHPILSVSMIKRLHLFTANVLFSWSRQMQCVSNSHKVLYKTRMVKTQTALPHSSDSSFKTRSRFHVRSQHFMETQVGDARLNMETRAIYRTSPLICWTTILLWSESRRRSMARHLLTIKAVILTANYLDAIRNKVTRRRFRYHSWTFCAVPPPLLIARASTQMFAFSVDLRHWRVGTAWSGQEIEI